MQIACNKEKTIALARKLGITTPKSYTHTQTIEDFPIVAKGVEGTGQVRYISHPNDLASIPSDGVILQEYIPGEACGFFALYNHGNIRAFFMHRRITEYPVTGGPSTKAESIYDPELKEKGLTLLNALNWHGLAMVEFKRDNRNGELTLMEINPKCWGSMDLAIASGVDFPYLAVRMAVEGDVEPVYKYNEGVKFRWPFPEEVLRLLARPGSLRSFFQDCIDKGVRSNLSLKDIKPNLFQIALTVSAIATGIRHKSLLYPHGRPVHEA
jgi:predicted ATP-grasp superfamily ATP-dependent carboligase